MGFFARLQAALPDADDAAAEIILAAFWPAEDTPAPDPIALQAALASVLPDEFVAPVIDEPDT
jgi:hypothetical protein